MNRRIKLNRRDYIDFDNIEKIVQKGSILWVYKVKGYPKVTKTEFGISVLLRNCINAGITGEEIVELKKSVYLA